MSEDNLNFQKNLLDYIEYFETLNPRSIRLIEKIATPDMNFKDPFNDVIGLEKVEAIFEHMFQNTQNPKFKVLDYAWGKNGDTAYLRWNFTCLVKGKQNRIDGMSEVLFSRDGKVMSHIDHWDASEGFYDKLPVLGTMIRFVKSKLAID